MRHAHSTPRRLPIPLILVLLLTAVLPGSRLAAEAEQRPLDLDQLADLLNEPPGQPWNPEGDPCACLQQLRGCLLAATLNLGRCVVRLPVGDTLCYVKYEIEVLLCIYQADNCASVCIP